MTKEEAARIIGWGDHRRWAEAAEILRETVPPPRPAAAPRNELHRDVAFLRQIQTCPHFRWVSFGPLGAECAIDMNGRGWIDVRVDCYACFHPAAAPAPTAAARMALHRRIAACPHWSRGSVSCGCGTCALGRGDGGRVSADDCAACLNRPLEPLS